jgi:hypothetical protein
MKEAHHQLAVGSAHDIKQALVASGFDRGQRLQRPMDRDHVRQHRGVPALRGLPVVAPPAAAVFPFSPELPAGASSSMRPPFAQRQRLLRVIALGLFNGALFKSGKGAASEIDFGQIQCGGA